MHFLEHIKVTCHFFLWSAKACPAIFVSSQYILSSQQIKHKFMGFCVTNMQGHLPVLVFWPGTCQGKSGYLIVEAMLQSSALSFFPCLLQLQWGSHELTTIGIIGKMYLLEVFQVVFVIKSRINDLVYVFIMHNIIYLFCPSSSVQG